MDKDNSNSDKESREKRGVLTTDRAEKLGQTEDDDADED